MNRCSTRLPPWNHRERTLVIACFCALSVLNSAGAVDKSGVSPTTISLPSGPGSIEGLGSQYQPQLNTGTGNYNFPLKLPSGTAGNTPVFALTYEGGLGNGPLGIGWSLGIPVIRRQCEKGIPRYEPNGRDDDFDGLTDESDEQDRFLDPSGEELVLTDKGYYFSENNQDFVRYWFDGDAWTARRPDGALLRFGLTSSGRVQDGADVYVWLLETTTDTNGNVIEYHYTDFPDSQNQKYLHEIRYGPGSPPWDCFYLVAFTYEYRPDWFEDYRSGFQVRTGKRLKQIDIALQGALPEGHLVSDVNQDGTSDALVRRYELAYETDLYWSLLSSITLIGADGTSALPPARFGYTHQLVPHVISAAGAVIGVQNEPEQMMDNSKVELIDLNADALPDLLRADGGPEGHVAWLHLGVHDYGAGDVIEWSQPVQVADAPSGDAWTRDISRSDVHLADMDGDGLADLAQNPVASDPFYFRNLGTLAWAARQDVSVRWDETRPPSPFDSNSVRSFDANFDKRIDLVRSDQDGYFVWYMLGQDIQGRAWYSPPIQTPGPIPFPGGEVEILFDQTAVFLADMNGDRMVDPARILPDRVVWYPNRGYGNCAERVETLIPPDDGFGHDSGFHELSSLPGEQLSRAALRDINGDGLCDLVAERAVPQELWFWINLGNRTFSQRCIVTDLPPVYSMQVETRWVDLNGNGTTDLVYADSSLPDGERIQTVDVGLLTVGSVNPNLLSRIENGIGMTTRIEYRPSTAYAVADALSGQPWSSLVPNAVNVVSRVVVSDGLGHDYVTEYRYHDGYYDGVEKQFRGFRRTEQLEIGDVSQPTLATELHFDVGESEEPLKGKVVRTIVRTEQGGIFTEEDNYWYTRSLFSVLPPPEDPLAPRGVTFPYLGGKNTIVREEPSGATEPVTLEMDYLYDDYGNVVLEANYGRTQSEDRNYGSDERLTWKVYSATPQSAIWNLEVESVVTDNAEPPQVFSHSRSYYDGSPFEGLPSGSVGAGNLTRLHRWVGAQNTPNPPDPLPEPDGRFLLVTRNADGTLSFSIVDSASQPIEVPQDRWIDSVRYRYDQYGNVVASADPLAHIIDGSPDLTIGHFREFTYEPELHAYPTEEQVFTGSGRLLLMRVAYDSAFGTVTDSWDFNGNLTRYAYDPFSRLRSTIRPGGNPPDSPEMPTTSYEYMIMSPVSLADGSGTINWIETRQHERYGDPDAYFASRSFVDGLGRILMIKEEDEDPDRTVVKQATVFNARRRPFQTLLPFFSAGGFEFEDLGNPAWRGTWIIAGGSNISGLVGAPSDEIYYDATGREIKRIQSDGTFTQSGYFPLGQRISDEEDSNPSSQHFATPLIHYLDGLDRLVGVDEVVRMNDDGTPSLTAAVWDTRYHYNPRDDLTMIVDSQNNRKTLQYNGLSRKVYVDDPDRGRVWHLYDEASNVVETVDPKGQRTTYTYDGANRLLTEDYHDEGQPFSANRTYDPELPMDDTNRPDVAYFYDIPAPTVDLGDGREGTATNTNGFLAYVVDLSGEEHTSYDDRGHVTWVVKRIPDSEHGRMVSYKTEIDHDPSDRVVKHLYPDNDQVTYEYNNRGLLERIHGGASVNRDGNPYVIEDVNYVPSGQASRCLYGNGVATEYLYDRRQRMVEMKTSGNTAPATSFIHYSYTFDGVSNISRIDDLRPGTDRPEDDERRNTQIFGYDNLYRLTHVQYSFSVPGAVDRNDGQIDFRYNRIGNMLFKSSPDGEGHIDDPVVVNMGEMNYGGFAGSWNRVGRGGDDDPGPHALTSTSTGRSFSYDPNGNMTDRNEFECTWDFKNRLVILENHEWRTEYTYDYADRRTSKRVCHLTNAGTFERPISTTTTYVNQYFEVRKHDQPVKYVWNDGVRVARVTGTLDSNVDRIQRLRVRRGWNLLSLAVESATAASQIAAQTGSDPSGVVAYIWCATSNAYNPVRSDEPLPPSIPFWIQAATDTALVVVGDYVDPSPVVIPSGKSFLPSAGLEAICLEDSLPFEVTQVMMFDPLTASWNMKFRGDLNFFSMMAPEFLPPGRALFLESSATFQIDPIPISERIQYYHQDHLGSTNIVADASGKIIEENIFYPFGEARNQEGYAERRELISGKYLFSQKERDLESGLHYFETRYLAASLCRFNRPDPMVPEDLRDWLVNPQKLNPYAYALNRPLVRVDPTGSVDVGELFRGVGKIAVGTVTTLGGVALAKVGCEIGAAGSVTGVGLAVGSAAAVAGTSLAAGGVTTIGLGAVQIGNAFSGGPGDTAIAPEDLARAAELAGVATDPREWAAVGAEALAEGAAVPGSKVLGAGARLISTAGFGFNKVGKIIPVVRAASDLVSAAKGTAVVGAIVTSGKTGEVAWSAMKYAAERREKNLEEARKLMFPSLSPRPPEGREGR